MPSEPGAALRRLLVGPARAPFVGREREVSALLERMRAAERGDGGVVLVSGEPGVGKSRLLGEVADRARGSGWLTLTGRAYDVEGMPPYLPFIEVLRDYFGDLPNEGSPASAAEVRPELAWLIPEARTQAARTALPSPETDREMDRYRLFEALADLLLTISRSADHRGLLLALDDLHWADRSTLLLLLHLARKLGPAPLLVVGTYRTAEVAPDRPIFDALADLSRERLHSRLHLIAFSLDEMRVFVHRLSGVNAPNALLASIYEQTAGNPFFVEEVVRHLQAEGRDLAGSDADATGWGIPEGVRQVIGKRVARLSGEANRLMQAAAVLGVGVGMGPLGEVADMTGTALVEALEQATGAGVIREEDGVYRFSHPLVQRTIYDSLSLARRQMLHLRAARALESASSPRLEHRLSALAVHYRLAGSGGDVEKAIEYSLRAGEAANAVHAYEEATSHWKAALRLMDEHSAARERRADLLQRLGDLMCVTSLDYAKGVEYLGESLDLYSGLARTHDAALVHIRLGRHLSTLYDVMDPERAREHFRDAEALLGVHRAEAPLAAIHGGVASTAMWSVRTREGLDASRRAIEIAERLHDDAQLAHALALHAWHLAASGSLAEARTLGDRACQLADQLDDPVVAVVAGWLRGTLSYLLGDPSDGRSWYARELAKSRIAQAPVQRRRLANLLAWTHAFSGDLEQARRVLYQADHAPPEQWVEGGVAFWGGEWQRAKALWTGDLEVRRRNGDRFSVADDLWLLGRAQSSLDEKQGARARFEEALAIGLDGHVVLEMRARVELALSCVESGRTDEARLHLVRCEELLSGGEDWRGLGGRVALAEGALAASEGSLQEAERSFGRAFEAFRRFTLPWDEAEALYVWGRHLMRAHRRAAALAKLDGALDTYRRLGAARTWTAAIEKDRDALLGRSGTAAGAAVYPDGLSGREVDVLRLIAQGKSNREIAVELFLSSRTVERHIANIYGKLDLHSRTQATAYAFSHDLARPQR